MAKMTDSDSIVPGYFSPNDEKYYRPDDMAVLSVSDKKYRINTRWLKKHSPRLANIIKACPDPRDELHPLNVPDVTTAQFEALLDFIDDSNLSDFKMHADRWADLLATTHHLQIKSIKSRVVREVFDVHFDAFGHVEQLAFYEAYAVDRNALRHAVLQIITRPKSLTAEEMSQLSPALLSRIVSMREEYLRSVTKAFGAWKASGVADSLAGIWVKDG